MKTIPEQKAMLEAMEAEIREEVTRYNTLMLEEKAVEAMDLSNETDKKIAEYSALARKVAFNICQATGDPMMAAVQRPFYEVIVVKEDKPEGQSYATHSVDTKSRQIDLIKLDKHCGGIGLNKNWVYTAQKINSLLCAKVAGDIIKDKGGRANAIKSISDSFRMADIARQIDMGKDPTSNTQILKTLQRVITEMIGDTYKAKSQDVRYLLYVYAKKSRKALTLQVSNNTKFVSILLDICHGIVMEKDYGVEFQMRKEH